MEDINAVLAKWLNLRWHSLSVWKGMIHVELGSKGFWINRKMIIYNPNPLEQSKKNKFYMIVSYTQGLYKSIKNIYNKYGIWDIFKGGRTIKNPLVAPKDRDTLNQKMESSTDTSVAWLNVMVYWWIGHNIWRDLRNIFRPPLPYMTTSTYISPHDCGQCQHSGEGEPESQ